VDQEVEFSFIFLPFYLPFLLIIFPFCFTLAQYSNKNDYWTPKPQPTTKEREKEIKRVK